ncbi:hypothetical protein [Bradyrhizobium retamae]|uniref:hypothetical protein n=1 Tax=Bradyrhizobium retamae TaxID=1300035 RepID=UPI001AECCBB4|nr:hypothetical protein [Bradyrhizobium retamae]
MGSVDEEASIAAASLAKQRQDTLAKSATRIFPDIDVLCTVRHCGFASRNGATNAAARDQYKSKPNRFGKQKSRFDSPHRQARPDLSGSVYFA